MMDDLEKIETLHKDESSLNHKGHLVVSQNRNDQDSNHEREQSSDLIDRTVTWQKNETLSQKANKEQLDTSDVVQNITKDKGSGEK